MTSSNRAVPPCDATLCREGEAIGPMRLPMRDAAEFVQDFNNRYQTAGLQVVPVPESSKEQGSDQTKPVSGPSPQ